LHWTGSKRSADNGNIRIRPGQRVRGSRVTCKSRTVYESNVMIYKFKSQATADVIMQQFNGDQMLAIIGKEPAAQGVITLEQMPGAIAALEAAIAAHEAAQARLAEDPQAVVDVVGDSVLLRQRAAPFIELLQTSAQAGKDVVWGV